MKEYLWHKQYEEGVPTEIDASWSPSVGAVFEQSFEKYADNPAFTCMGKVLSYREVDRLSASFASYLQRDLGLTKGDRLALMMPNILQYPIALIGGLRAGLTIVNVNPLYTERELEHQLKDSGATTIVIMVNFAVTLQAVMDKVPIKNVVVTQIGDMLGFPKAMLINFAVKHVKKMVPVWNIPGTIPFKTALSRGGTGDFTKHDVGHEDIAFLQYTGGTTGLSKGAVLTHGNILANMTQSWAWLST